jgi:hypothetical protein
MQKDRKKVCRNFNKDSSKISIRDTRVRVSDSLRTEKTLPGINANKNVSHFHHLDKKGKVRKIDTGFMALLRVSTM